MDITWIDDDFDANFAKHSLSKLISSYLEPVNPSDAIDRTVRLIHLLLLSNHLSKAYELLTALYKHAPSVLTPDPYNDTPFAYTSLRFSNFFQAHQQKYPRPSNLPQPRQYCTHGCTSDEEHFAYAQWGKYRECTRTGWMLEHCSLPEPENPHCWKDTDEPRMLAMCARLLAKHKTEGEYPRQERLKEAFEAAKKLYAQPQECITEWDFKEARKEKTFRHSALLYRRLVVELAIRVGDLEGAVEMMSLGLRIDGFATGSELDVYLMIPGIYDVLPLLAERGKKGNPFFIEEEDADEIVKQLVATMELRATKGRQWSLAPEKVGWKELLDRLAKAAWKVNRKEYKSVGLVSAKDILYEPATEEAIRKAEEECGELPQDFKDMVRVANGFKGGYHLFGGGILGIQGIHIADENDITDCQMQEDYYGRVMLQLEAGAECDLFNHYIVTPATFKAKADADGREIEEGEYIYWHWACWQGGGSRCWKSVRDYVACCVEEVEGMIEKGEKVDNGNDSDQDPYSDDDDDEEEEEEESSWVIVQNED